MMTVHGILLTDDIVSIRILYEKNGKYFVRRGVDKFKVGVKLPTSYMSMFTQNGFRKVLEPLPVFRDAEEMFDGSGKFALTKEGSVQYEK